MAAAQRQSQLEVWNRLHMILNTWQQLERRKGERQKKSVFSKKKKEKEKQSRAGSSRSSLPLFFFVFSHFSFLLSEFQARSSSLMSVQLSNTETEMFAACALSSSQQNLCAFLTERRTMEAEI